MEDIKPKFDSIKVSIINKDLLKETVDEDD
jgi:hypothetical protein